MSARDEILAALRQHQLPEVDVSAPQGTWITYEDRVGQFVETLEGVGGQACICTDRAAVKERVAAQSAFQQARQICSLMPDVVSANVDLGGIDDPHALADLDFALLPGELAVAENAAVWVDTSQLHHRVVPFLVQHLALVVPRNQVYHNLHQAYEALELSQPGFGVFISGPSKTADIEQSLVIGAHGARSLTVYLVETL